MNHVILYSAVIIGSFIMQACHRLRDEPMPCVLWNIVGLVALVFGWFAP